jgi:futalosine hydrolase
MFFSGYVNHFQKNIGKDKPKMIGNAILNIFVDMLKILLVSATEMEISPVLAQMHFVKQVSGKIKVFNFQQKEVWVLITGVGMVSTAFEMGKLLSLNTFDCAINLGVAGAFNRNIKKGAVLNVVSDCFSDIGAQDDTEFLSLAEMGLIDADATPFENGWLVNKKPYSNSATKELTEVRGISVNLVHGEEKSIEKVVKRLQPDVESMEGAAFFYACLSEGVPCVQIRAISNYVEKRNRANWDIPKAVKHLNEIGLQVLKNA